MRRSTLRCACTTTHAVHTPFHRGRPRQVALGAVRDGMGSLSYVEFVLHPAAMFDTFVVVADRCA
jgi:hypothetical protein